MKNRGTIHDTERAEIGKEFFLIRGPNARSLSDTSYEKVEEDCKLSYPGQSGTPAPKAFL